MRNYFMVEKTTAGIFIAEGKGTNAPKGYDKSKNWNDWELMENNKALLARIKELLNK